MCSHPSLQSSGILISILYIKKLRVEEKLTHRGTINKVRAGIYGSHKTGFLGEAASSLYHDVDREEEGREGSKRQSTNWCNVGGELEDKL